MTTKMLEIRYKDMSIPVLATRMDAADKGEEAFIERVGYDKFNILITRLDDSRNPQIKLTPFSWAKEAPFMFLAHSYIENHFDEIPDKSVVDVEFVNGETQAPKKSDIWKYRRGKVMTLYYTFQIGYDDYDDFEYEVDAIEALEAIGVDIDDDIDIDEYAEEYRDEITDYYKDEAYEAWKDENDYNANPYGMSERDFF